MVKLVAPWVNYYREIEALFALDHDVNVAYDEENYTINVYVETDKKAEALTRLLPAEKQFGDVTIKTFVIPANDNDDSPISLFKAAFADNPAVDYIRTVQTPFGTFNYVIFIPEVVQYRNDDISDIHGLKSTLYQDIAKDVFTIPGVFFCTEEV